VSALAKCVHLRYVYLNCTTVSALGVDVLRAARPHADVRSDV